MQQRHDFASERLLSHLQGRACREVAWGQRAERVAGQVQLPHGCRARPDLIRHPLQAPALQVNCASPAGYLHAINTLELLRGFKLWRLQWTAAVLKEQAQGPAPRMNRPHNAPMCPVMTHRSCAASVQAACSAEMHAALMGQAPLPDGCAVS